MNKWIRVGGLATLVALVALVAFGAVAFAQGPMGTPLFQGGRWGTAPMGSMMFQGRGMGQGSIWGHMAGIGGPQNSLVAVAAKTLGMEQAALVAELEKGKTIADVAKEKNVATSKIVDAVIAVRTASLKGAVDAKRITQAQADAMLAQIKTHVTAQISAKFSPRGYGMGRGFADANKDGLCDHLDLARSASPMFGGRGRWAR